MVVVVVGGVVDVVVGWYRVVECMELVVVSLAVGVHARASSFVSCSEGGQFGAFSCIVVVLLLVAVALVVVVLFAATSWCSMRVLFINRS